MVMIKPNIGISDKNLDSITDILTKVLSDEMILYVMTRKFHWNVSGESFMELHKLFQAQYEQMEESIDQVAERINQLGGNTIGTMKEFLEQSTIEEHPGVYPAKQAMITELLINNEIMTRLLRKSIDECTNKYKDAVSADLLTTILGQHETVAWILRRYSN